MLARALSGPCHARAVARSVACQLTSSDVLRGEQLLVPLRAELQPHERVAAKVVTRATDQAETLSTAVRAVSLHDAPTTMIELTRMGLRSRAVDY
jgi:hypothetical protein